MNRIADAINPIELGQRLRSLRVRNRLTQMDIARTLGVSRPSVAAIEAGQRRIDARLIASLARAYQTSVSELVRDPGPQATLQAQFRLPPELAPLDREQLEGAVIALETLASNYLRIEEIMRSPLRSSPVPRYSYESDRVEQDAELIAQAERRRLGIGDGPVLRLRELLEREAGLRIFHLALPGGIAGLYGYAENAGPCVAINAHHPLVRQRWSTSHEYGHYVTRLDRLEATSLSAYQRLPEPERFAERFAGAFLMPSAGLERRVQELSGRTQRISVADLLLLTDEYEVSLQALVLRLEDLHLLQASSWDILTNSGANIRAASQLLGIQKPQSDTLKYPKRYVLLALDAYGKALLTERELADLLGQDRLATREIMSTFSRIDRERTDDTTWEIGLSESVRLGE